MAKSGSSRSSVLRIAVLAFSAVLAIQGLIPPAPAAAKEVAKLTTIRGTNFVSAGLGGMRGSGNGTAGSGVIHLAGIPEGATVTRALLYWNGPTNSGLSSANAAVTFGPTFEPKLITGSQIGFSNDNCWNFQNSQSYRADVTNLVSGNGDYTLANFRKAPDNVVVADINGVSLIVFFDDPGAELHDVTVFEGNDSNKPSGFDMSDGWQAALDGITYSGGTASLQLHVSDGQAYEDGALSLNNIEFSAADSAFNGDTVPGPSNLAPFPTQGSEGNLWDIKNYNITDFMKPGVNDLALTAPYVNDCLSLVVAVVSVPSTYRYLRNSTWLHPFDLTNKQAQKDGVPSAASRWYRLKAVPAQSQVNVTVTGFPPASVPDVDVTLVAYRDVPAVATRLIALTGSATDVQTLTASQDIGADDMAGDDMAGDDMAGDDMAGDDMAGDDMAGDDMAGDDMAGDDMAGGDIAKFSNVYTTAQPPSVLAISATPGHAAEFLSVNARAGGDLYFRVRKSVRELSPADGHYTITASYVSAPGCDTTAARNALAKQYTPGTLSFPTGKATLMLTNTQRFGLTGVAKDQFLTMLGTVAGKSYVNGFVFDLATNTGTNSIMDAYADWAASPTCVELANRVTDVVKNAVNQFRQANRSTMKYGVNVGGDRIVPLRRVLDRVPPPLKTEVQYSPPLDPATPVDASLAGNYYLTADFYAASAPITRFGGEVWLPEFSWGVLVETPDDIKAYLDTFVAANGLVQNPSRALSMGFDWNADTAQAIADDLGTSGTNTDKVINADTSVPLGGYTAADIKAKLANLWSSAGYLGVQGHATATSLKAADNATHLYTTDIADIAAGQAMKTGIVVTLGCHSTFNIQDVDVTNPLVQKLAWPEAFMAQGKTLLGGTGYQYAETVLIKNTERLLTLFTNELRFTNGLDMSAYPVAAAGGAEVPIGAAHVNAKRRYMSELTSFTGLDQKVLGVSQIFGMPMLRYNLGTTARLSHSQTSLTTEGGQSAGLSVATVSYDFTQAPTQLKRCNATGCTGVDSDPSYFAVDPQLTHAVSFRPIIARNATNIDGTFQGNATVARGAVIMKATFNDTPLSPLTVLPVTEQPGTRPRYVSPVFSPWPVALNEYLNQQLVWMPTQYQSNADGTSFTLRKFDSSETQVYYSNLFNERALVDAPVIRSVVISAGDNVVHLVLNVQAHFSVGIESIWATSLGGLVDGNCDTTAVGTGTPCFVSQPMTGATAVPDPLASDRFTQEFTLDVQTGAPVILSAETGAQGWRGFFQAVGGNGLVRLANNLGALYRVTSPATPENPKTPTQLVGSATSPAAYRSFLSASATWSATGTAAPLAGHQITFRLGSVTRTAATNDKGVATVQLAVEVLPRALPYRLLIGFAEDETYLASGAGLDIKVDPAPTQFKLVSPAPTLSSPGTGVLAKLCLSSDSACLGSNASSTSPPGINEQLALIDLGSNGKVLTTTDGFGQLRLDSADFCGLAAKIYTGSISTFDNRLYKKAGPTPIQFTVGSSSPITMHSVQGQGTFTTDADDVNFTPGNPATFEFNVTHTTGCAGVTGNLGFHVKAQKFDFVATSYTWTTIVGSVATVDGYGTLSTQAGNTPGVHFRMTVEDRSAGDIYEIRIGPYVSTPQWSAKATNLKSSAVTIK